VSRRVERVEELLRRELSEVILHGGLRDPRLKRSSAISITGVSVSPDLAQATVFIDVLAEDVDPERVLAGLQAGRGAIRARLADRVHLKRVPNLSFRYDEAISRAARIETILAEVNAAAGPDEDEPEPDEP
jgi:ribosome-binding factor A